MKTIFNCRSITLPAAFLVTLSLWAWPGVLSAHGVIWEISAQKSYGVEFSYDDESPMAYAEVKIYGPDDPAKLSQTGRADKNGGFAFIPDADGRWFLNADDGAGHLAKAELTVSLGAGGQGEGAGSFDAAAAAVNVEREVAKAAKPIKIGLVISLFLNVAFLAMMMKRKKTAQ